MYSQMQQLFDIRPPEYIEYPGFTGRRIKAFRYLKNSRFLKTPLTKPEYRLEFTRSQKDNWFSCSHFILVGKTTSKLNKKKREN